MHEPPSLHFLFMDLGWDPGLQTDAMYMGMRSGSTFGSLAEEITSAGARLTTHDSAQECSDITTVRQQHKLCLHLRSTWAAASFSFLAAPFPSSFPVNRLEILMVAAR